MVRAGLAGVMATTMMAPRATVPRYTCSLSGSAAACALIAHKCRLPRYSSGSASRVRRRHAGGGGKQAQSAAWRGRPQAGSRHTNGQQCRRRDCEGD